VICYPGPLAPPGAIVEELGWRGTLVRRFMDRPIIAVAISAPVWAAFHLPVIFAPGQVGHTLQNIFFLGSVAAGAAPFAALYLWSRSVWPCVVLHYTWNVWNPFLLGDVYGGGAGLFGGAVWAFNGEGLFGLLIQGAVTVWLIQRWRRKSASQAQG
jgi:membrane protease YdiL (CAAX protease family)